MMNKKILAKFVAATLFTVCSQTGFATETKNSDATFSEFKVSMLNHIDMVGSASLQRKFAELSEQDWDFIFDSFADKASFIKATISMERLSLNNGRIGVPVDKTLGQTEESLESFGSRVVMAAMTFTPAYPSGSDYDAFTATMPGLGMLVDSSDIGTESGTALNDERCDTNGEAGAQIALAALKVAAEIGNTACSATPSPFEPAACIPAGVLNEAVIADEIVLAQCSYQTALVDSAEIEATYENSVELIGTVNNIDVIINDETNFTDDSELDAHDQDMKVLLADHDTDIKNVIDVHDTDIKNVVNVHDVDIKTALGVHDADIKALLTVLQAGVDENGEKLDLLLERQLEVVRLLHTPNGRRSSDIPACNGGPCTWNP